MNIKNNLKTGFTIVEISLFLGLSGLLAAGLMVGWSVNINRQRYNDSVNTFKSGIQQVFSDVENTQNSRSNSYSCNVVNGNVSITTGSEIRGQSKCTVLGKLISVGSAPGTGTSLTRPVFFSQYAVRDVIGLDIDTSTACDGQPCKDDIEALRATNYIITSSNSNNIKTQTDNTLEWNAAIKAITDNSNSQFSGSLTTGTTKDGITITNTVYGVLILRSPIDGTIRVFGLPTFTHSSNSKDGNKFYYDDSAKKTLRDTLMSDQTILTNDKKVDFCVAPKLSGNLGYAENSLFSRNKVVRIGNTSASVEIAPMDGARSVTCVGNKAGLEGVYRG